VDTYFRTIHQALENSRMPNTTGKRLQPKAGSSTQKRRANFHGAKATFNLPRHCNTRRGKGHSAAGLNTYWGGRPLTNARGINDGAVKGSEAV
jgi:hypothetical protein